MILDGQVGSWHLEWTEVPRGRSGVGTVKVSRKGEADRTLEVRWRMDGNGIWIELPTGVHGFDLEGSRDEDGRIVYLAAGRGSRGDLAFSGLGWMRAGVADAVKGKSGAAKKGIRVRAQMPGKIVRVSIKPGDVVEKGQSLLVMEAMKMENEIKAPEAGKVASVLAQVGQAVESGADLILIDRLSDPKAGA